LLPEDHTDRGLWIIAASCAGAVAGLAPDLLEPAIHPNHRAFFHSVGVALALGYAGKKTWDGVKKDGSPIEPLTILVLALASGYGSHLTADFLTPKSLPLL
jgi:membrane-bound metal-dependent hydrolase YbcI (DUF457 family)